MVLFNMYGLPSSNRILKLLPMYNVHNKSIITAQLNINSHLYIIQVVQNN